MSKPIRVQRRRVCVDLPQVDNGRVGLCGLSCLGLCLGLRRCVVQNIVDDLQVGEPLHLQLVRVQVCLDGLYTMMNHYRTYS